MAAARARDSFQSMSWSERPFANRSAAGAELARVIRKLRLAAPLVVLGLPRGGVPVAAETARALSAPLDVLVVRKVGMPGQPEFAIGAIGPANTTVRHLGPTDFVTTRDFEELAQKERQELRRRERRYRAGLPPLDLDGATAILIDDGLATGCTMLAAIRAARKLHAGKVIAAVPIASDTAEALIRREADRVVALKVSAALTAVGAWYEEFDQVSDEEVCGLLDEARNALTPGRIGGAATSSRGG